jgi:hypothetical protein
MAESIPEPGLDKVDWRVFLIERPPGVEAAVEGAIQSVGAGGCPVVNVPELRLYCDRPCQSQSYCHGDVRAQGSLFPGEERECHFLLYYSCIKCGGGVKSYGIRFLDDWTRGQLYPHPNVLKVVEWPPFSPRTPSKVNSLIGSDRELFLKGRRAESEGLGVGAFAYYRRIVEDQKSRLLDEIIRVARRTNAPPETISRFEDAKAETQFSNAVDMVKDAVPQSLRIKGHNPLTLLHRALSRDLHGASDEECLKDAHAIRVVLFELADRIGQALKDEQELNDSLTRLLNPRP